mmetsp:Transcript_15633/g.51310  ORF Transcript_15633/g.51310 Transcript_15633/m.51310 type:complete len:252 (+) Transcript_15633:484-1239(+)
MTSRMLSSSSSSGSSVAIVAMRAAKTFPWATKDRFISKAAPCSASYSLSRESTPSPSPSRVFRSAAFLDFNSPVVTAPRRVLVTQPITPSAHILLAATLWKESFCKAPSRCRRALVSCSSGSTAAASAATTREPGRSRYLRPSPVCARLLISRSVCARTAPRHPSKRASTSDPLVRSEICLLLMHKTSPLIIVRTASTISTDASGDREIRHRSACRSRATWDSASSSSDPNFPSDMSSRSTPPRNSKTTSR